uniref:Sulfotransferase n=1 Tax=Rhizophora mucronata TaxID=61149 RepID=A0A2P2IRK7_RHIMU
MAPPFSLPTQNTFAEESDMKDTEVYAECERIIASLPRNGSWNFDLYQYEGFWYWPYLIAGTILSKKLFKPKPSHIILGTFPKCGTTWIKALTLAVATRNQYDDSTNPLRHEFSHDCVPFYEHDFIDKVLPPRNLEHPLISTHTSYGSLPKSVMDSGCKIIYTCRDPKDAFVSLWHFWRTLAGVDPPPIEDAFELFCNGVSFCGPYWDHALGYWNASLERPDKVLFLKFDDMKRDTLLHIKRIAEFMGYPFSAEEEKEGMVEKIKDLCSFENLKSLEINKKGDFFPVAAFSVEKQSFFRKGKVGDWKNHLTPEMAARLDNIMQEKLKGSGLTLAASSHD